MGEFGAANNVVLIPGSGQLLRQADRVDAVLLPYESFKLNKSGSLAEDYKSSYVIDHKRFVEPYSSRCFASTILQDPDSVEPQFVVVRARSEVRVNATAPLAAIRAAHFDPARPTTILVHGFTQSYPGTEWLRRARALFERHGLVARENLLIMDWAAGSHGSYAQVAATVSGMGSFLANFLLKLLELGADRRSIHIIGHSLGAHLAGFAGKRIRPQLGRITALDAAGPCFGKLFSNSANDRLSLEDAYQVDVLHYDDSFLGLGAQIGHFDVFVNGGSSQPGAIDNVNSMLQALVTMAFRRDRALSESHSRSCEVAVADLAGAARAPGCQEIAYECRDWPAFLNGECAHCGPNNERCFLMSFPFQYSHQLAPQAQPLRQTEAGKRLYIATSSQEAFCLNHFQVLVTFESAPDLAAQAKRNRWRLQLELRNERNERANVTLTHQLAPNVFSMLMLSEMAPSRFRAAKLQLRSGYDNSLVRLRAPQRKPANARPFSRPFRVHSVELNFMSHVEARVRHALGSRLCPAGWLPSGAAAADAPASNSIASSSPDQDEEQDEWLALEECRSS